MNKNAQIHQSFLDRHQSFMTNSESSPPHLYRVYHSTVQRLYPSITSLNTHAAYLVVLDEEKQILIWVGSLCKQVDQDLALEIGNEVMSLEYKEDSFAGLPMMYEDTASGPLLDAVCDILGSNTNFYNLKNQINDRKKHIENSPVSCGFIKATKINRENLFENIEDIKTPTIGMRNKRMQYDVEWTFEVEEYSFAHPDSHGTVPRINFIQETKNAIAYTNIGEQWDIWFSRDIEHELRKEVLQFIENLIETKIREAHEAGIIQQYFKVTEDETAPTPSENGRVQSPSITATLNSAARINLTKEMISQFYQTIDQGKEKVFFRRLFKLFTDFMPDRSVKEIINTLNRKSISRSSFVAPRTVSFRNPKDIKDGNIERETKGSNEEKKDESNAEDENKFNPKKGIKNVDKTKEDQFDYDYPTKPKNINTTTKTNSTTSNVKFWKDKSEEHNKPNNHPNNTSSMNTSKIIHTSTDRFQLSFPMLDLHDDENISILEKKELIIESCKNPRILLGWQIEIDEGLYHGIFVVIDCQKKGVFRKTYYQLSNIDETFWIRLSRSSTKSGLKFRPLRMVAVLE